MTSHGEIAPVPMIERLAYVLREWEESHATWAQPMVNGSHYFTPVATVQEPDPEPRKLEMVKTPCECQHCEDTRVVLAEYERRGGDERAERIR